MFALAEAQSPRCLSLPVILFPRWEGGGEGEPTLENSEGQRQIFALHNSPLQIHSPGPKRPTGQAPKIWGKKAESLQVS